MKKTFLVSYAFEKVIGSIIFDFEYSWITSKRKKMKLIEEIIREENNLEKNERVVILNIVNLNKIF